MIFRPLLFIKKRIKFFVFYVLNFNDFRQITIFILIKTKTNWFPNIWIDPKYLNWSIQYWNFEWSIQKIHCVHSKIECIQIKLNWYGHVHIITSQIQVTSLLRKVEVNHIELFLQLLIGSNFLTVVYQLFQSCYKFNDVTFFNKFMIEFLILIQCEFNYWKENIRWNFDTNWSK